MGYLLKSRPPKLSLLSNYSPNYELRLFRYFHLILAINLYMASRRLDRHALLTGCAEAVMRAGCSLMFYSTFAKGRIDSTGPFARSSLR